MLTSIIVDDEENNREALAKMLDLFCPDVTVLGKADSVDEALEMIDTLSPDVVFLDVEMPGGSGFTLFDRTKKSNFEVIFTTAHAEYAIKAIKFAAMDYLLKPINLNELKIAVEKVVEKTTLQKISKNENRNKHKVIQANQDKNVFEFKKIALATSDGVDFYEINNILRCEADRAYCNFYLKSGKKIVVSKSLREFEDILQECNFFRVHKSNMVNLSHVTKYVKGKGGYLILVDGSHVDVAVRKKEELMNVLSGAL